MQFCGFIFLIIYYWINFHFSHICNSDIESEKVHQSLLQGVESYDKTSLKPAETQEKFVLPAKEGNCINP